MAETTYTKVYRDFRGVDFTSNRSECDPSRFNYLVNMWRDYHSEQGAAVETAPGFRAAIQGNGGRVNGLHFLPRKEAGEKDRVIVHTAGELFGHDAEEVDGILTLGQGTKIGIAADARSNSVLFHDSLFIVDGKTYFSIKQGAVENGEDMAYVPTTYYNGVPYEQRNMLTDRFCEKYSSPSYEESHEFDGESSRTLHYVIHEPSTKLIYGNFGSLRGVIARLNDGSIASLIPFKTQKADDVVPTEGITLTNPTQIREVDWNEDIRIGYSQPDESLPGTYFMYVADSYGINYFLGYIRSTKEENQFSCGNNDYTVTFEVDGFPRTGAFDYNISEISIGDGYNKNRKIISKNTLYEMEINGTARPSQFNVVGDMRDVLSGNPDFPSGYSTKDAICECTIIVEFDGRIFLSGNPNLPNSVFYTQRDLTGYNNPFYIGCYNYLNDGTGRTPIRAMISTPTQLIVLKDDVSQGAAIYYHYGADNASEDQVVRDIQPRIYPRENGVPGVGCLGAACNFLDDPVFLSPRGLEAIGKSQVNLERTVTHRSSYVDGHLINEELRHATLAEWDGYLALLVPNGRMYLADSRQISSHRGDQQYEWYFWDDIGVWEGQTNRYVYLTSLEAPPETLGGYEVAYKPEEKFLPEGVEVKKEGEIRYAVEDGYAYPVDSTAEKEGGKFSEATALLSVNGRLLFGCQNGTVCVFNTDKRDENHYIVPEAFTHNGRRYLTGCATCSDACGRTNLTKSTARGTFALVTKAFPYTLLSVRVRTNDQPWHECDRVFAGEADFGHTDFSVFTFNLSNECIAIVREREKRWVEKQLYFVGECFESPFGIISATYNYNVAGKVRMR